MRAQSQNLGDMHKVASAGASVLLGSLFGNGLSYLYSILLAHNLSPREFGVYALALTTFTLVVLIARLGFETGALRFIPQALGRDDHRGAQRVIVQVTTLVLLASLGAELLLGV